MSQPPASAPGQASAKTPSKARTSPATIFAPVFFTGALVGLWYLAYHLFLSDKHQTILPPPHRIWQEAFADGDIRSRLWEALLNTAELSLIGLAFAIFLGCLTAVLMNLSYSAERGIYPWAVVLQTVPILALIPLVDVWFNNIDVWFFGFDANYKKRLLICVLIALFPIITNTFFGLKSAERNLHDLFSMHRSNRLVRLWKLEIPAALPATFVGFRIASGLSVIGAIVAEFLIGRGDTGIGTLINRFRGVAQYENLLATIFVSSLLGIAIFGLFSYLGNRSTRHWHASAAGV